MLLAWPPTGLVDEIDGLRISDSQNEVYCAPGKHEIVLEFSHRERGPLSGEGSGSTSGTVGVLLDENHIYRFTALFGFHTFSVTLWDETKGMADRPIVAEWSIRDQHVEYIKPNP